MGTKAVKSNVFTVRMMGKWCWGPRGRQVCLFVCVMPNRITSLKFDECYSIRVKVWVWQHETGSGGVQSIMNFFMIFICLFILRTHPPLHNKEHCGWRCSNPSGHAYCPAVSRDGGRQPSVSLRGISLQAGGVTDAKASFWRPGRCLDGGDTPKTESTVLYWYSRSLPKCSPGISPF